LEHAKTVGRRIVEPQLGPPHHTADLAQKEKGKSAFGRVALASGTGDELKKACQIQCFS